MTPKYLAFVTLLGVAPLAATGCDTPETTAGNGTSTSTSTATAADASDATSSGGEDTAVATADGGDAATSVEADTAVTVEDTSEALPTFSFFVTSLRAMQELSENEQGFGGDLRFGETGAGAGLRGADKICATIAEESLPGTGEKTWRAFLSAAHGEDGQQVDAIDRIGEGPWYDRLGRVFAANKADLMNDRPTSADALIKNDFPNEDGVPNHRPDPTKPEVDNHDVLTGSNEEGRLYAADAHCLDWTGGTGNKTTEGKPRVGHSWPRTGGGPHNAPGMGDNNMANWMSALTESGCAPGVNLVEQGGPIESSNTVGSGGGYGGIYCFALEP